MKEGTAKYVHRVVTTTFSVWCDTDEEVEAAKKMSTTDWQLLTTRLTSSITTS